MSTSHTWWKLDSFFIFKCICVRDLATMKAWARQADLFKDILNRSFALNWFLSWSECSSPGFMRQSSYRLYKSALKPSGCCQDSRNRKSVQRLLKKTTCLQGLEQDIQVFVLRLPIYVYDESSFISFMANLQVEAAKKMQTASYIGSGRLFVLQNACRNTSAYTYVGVKRMLSAIISYT